MSCRYLFNMNTDILSKPLFFLITEMNWFRPFYLRLMYNKFQILF